MKEIKGEKKNAKREREREWKKERMWKGREKEIAQRDKYRTILIYLYLYLDVCTDMSKL